MSRTGSCTLSQARAEPSRRGKREAANAVTEMISQLMKSFLPPQPGQGSGGQIRDKKAKLGLMLACETARLACESVG